MTTISIDNSSSIFDSVDKTAYKVAYRVFGLFKGVSRLPLFFAWVIGLALLTTVGVVYTILAYVPLLVARKKLTREVNKMIGVIGSLSEREVMLELADIEVLRITLEKAARLGREFFVFLPIVHEIRKSAAALHKLEIALFTKACPESRKPLTPEEGEKLFQTTLPWREDWENKSMDVYNR